MYILSTLVFLSSFYFQFVLLSCAEGSNAMKLWTDRSIEMTVKLRAGRPANFAPRQKAEV